MSRSHRRFPLWILSILLLLVAGNLAAQSSTTSTIRGRVTDEAGAPIAGAEITATSNNSGFTNSTTSRADGSFVLGGLTPGAFTLAIVSPRYQPQVEQLEIRVGQTVDLAFRLAPGDIMTEEITVVGNQLIETKTSEAATNVTPLQIESLPQNERNFLNFAVLAPGIRLSTNPQRKTIAGDAQPAEGTNIFIDGVSFKNDVLQGGVAGQDASRGNPFPQNAVQEFRVITQNYSAQYEKASSAIITAVTKSGGNKITGDAFVFYQPDSFVGEFDDGTPGYQFAGATATDDPEYHRYQTGVSFSGPIIRDRLHYFLSYEGDQEHAIKMVNLGNSAFADRFGQFTGTFPAPFRSNLFFGKGSFQPGGNMLLDLSANYRTENEIRDFGGTTSAQAATDLENAVKGATLRHQWTGTNWLNQASLSYQTYYWNPRPLNPNLVGLEYQGAIRIGGNSTEQNFEQRRLELRDDFNFPAMQWNGTHNLQAGGNIDFAEYEVTKFLTGNPIYRFRNNPAAGETFDIPFEASFGFGDPNLNTDNQQYGIYIQDNWLVNNRLTLNLGLRWDYESDLIDTDYVTPANIRAGLAGALDPVYFSTGSEREQFKDAWQPRLGFSYDLRGDSRSVIYGGAGRYYDRIFLNSTLDERFRLQYPTYRIAFSPDGRPGTIRWDPSYLTPEGLRGLIASGSARPEIFLIHNDLEPPYSNQFNIGYRQTLGSWLGSVSYNAVRGYNGLTFVSATGICCSALVPGFGNVIISDREGKEYKYDAIYFTLDRPYTAQNRWGVRIAYTYADAKQTGNDMFSLDLPSAAEYGFHAVPGSERQRLVATGIFGLPFDFRFSTIVSLGSGAAANVLDFSQGFSLEARRRTRPFLNSIYPEEEWGPFADRNIDLRIEKDFPLFGGTRLGVIGEVFNATNSANLGCLANFIPPEGNPNFGNPTCTNNLPRRFQLGLRVSL